MKTKVKTKVKTKKKIAKKTSISDSEMRWYIANFIDVGCTRIINQWIGRRGKNGQRQQRHTMPTWGVATSQSCDGRSRIVFCSIQVRKGITSWPVQTWTGRNNKEKKNVEKTFKMPAGVITNIQLDQLARRMHVPYFIDVFMHNASPISGARRIESGIVNLDDTRSPGTHWVVYAKKDNRVIYFDSFGNLRLKNDISEIVWQR